MLQMCVFVWGNVESTIVLDVLNHVFAFCQAWESH